MKTNLTTLLGAAVAGGLVIAAAASASAPADAAPAATSAQASDPLITRGRYLVEHVGLCADCHSPRDERGQFRRELWMKGAPLPFQPTVPMPWSPAAPPLAGLPSMTTERRHSTKPANAPTARARSRCRLSASTKPTPAPSWLT